MGTIVRTTDLLGTVRAAAALPILVRRRHVDLLRICSCACPGSR